MNDGYLIVTIFGLVAGAIAGHVMFRADYCAVSMLRDLFMFRDATMLRFLLLQIALTMALLEIARSLGGLPYYPSVWMGPANLSSVVGGAIFGVGMVLTGSCVVGCLYKAGAGSVLGVYALLSMIVGATLFAEFASAWQEITASWVVTYEVTLPQSLHITAGWMVWPVVAVLAVAIWRWSKAGLMQLPVVAQGFIQPWKAAVILSVVTLASCFFTGMPIGITTCYVKIGAWFEQMVFPAHVADIGYFNNEVLNYVPPFASQAIRGAAGSQFDAIAALQLSVIIGIVLGAFASSVRVGEFRWSFRVPFEHYVLVIVGGLLVGFGARVAPGCNIWHILGGVPLLAWNSLLFVLGVVPGTWLGSKILLTRIK